MAKLLTQNAIGKSSSCSYSVLLVLLLFSFWYFKNTKQLRNKKKILWKIWAAHISLLWSQTKWFLGFWWWTWLQHCSFFFSFSFYLVLSLTCYLNSNQVWRESNGFNRVSNWINYNSALISITANRKQKIKMRAKQTKPNKLWPVLT